MKEFDLSDKEIKALLQEEGLEEPSMAFNSAILSQISGLEERAKPVMAPKWLVITLLLMLIIPSIIRLHKFDYRKVIFCLNLTFRDFT